MKVMFFAYSILVFILPLAFFPQLNLGFELSKLILVYLFALIIIIIHKNKSFSRTIFSTPILLFLFSQFISTIFSISPKISFFGYSNRANYSFLFLTSLFVIYQIYVSTNFSQKQKNFHLKLLLASSFLVSLIAISEKSKTLRVFSTLGQPNFLGNYLSIIFPLTLFFIFKTKKFYKKIFLTLILITQFYAIYLTKSQSSYLAILISLFAFIYLKQKNFINKFLVILLLFVSLFFIFFKYNFFDEQAQIRFFVWQSSINAIFDKPFLGNGVNSFPFIFPKYKIIKLNYTSEWNLNFDKAHNEYINILVESGIFGLISYLALCIIILKKAPKKFVPSFVSIFVFSFFSFNTITTYFLFFFLLAQSSKNINKIIITKKFYFSILIIFLTLFLYFYKLPNNKNIDVLFLKQKAVNEFNNQNYQNSLYILEKIKDHSPTDPVIFYLISRNYEKTNNLLKAYENIEKSLILKNDFDKAIYFKAYLRQKMI